MGGWTPGEGNARDLGALAVGVYEDGKLRFAGKVGSGFTGKWRTELRRRLADLETERAPFDPAPDRRGELRSVTWVRPELVIRAEIGGWTRDGVVRQTAFKGIDEGHDPTAVTRERPVASAKAAAEAEELMPERPKTTKTKASSAKTTTAKASSAEAASARNSSAKPASPTARSAAARAPSGPSRTFAGATDEELAALAALPNEGLWQGQFQNPKAWRDSRQ